MTTFNLMCNVSVMNKRLFLALALLSASALVGITRLAVWDTSNFGAFVILPLGVSGTILLVNHMLDREERSAEARGTME